MDTLTKVQATQVQGLVEAKYPAPIASGADGHASRYSSPARSLLFMIDLSYQYLTDPQKIRSHIEWLNRNAQYVVCDTETTGKNAHKAELVDVQVSGKHDKEVVIFSAKHAEYLKLISARMVWQNMKYDLIILHRHGVDLRDKEHWDTMLVEHLLDENMWSYSLPALINKHTGYDVGYKDDFWTKYKSYLDAPERERYEYGAQDIYWTGFVYRSQLREVGSEWTV